MSDTGGALISEVRAADDRARGQGHRQAHAHRDTDEGHADRADRRPGRTGDAGEDRAHDDDERQIPRRVQKTEAEVDDVGHRAACHPRGDQHTDDQQDQDTLEGIVQGANHRLHHILELDVQEAHAEDHHHDDGADESGLGVEAEANDAAHDDCHAQQEGDQRTCKGRLALHADGLFSLVSVFTHSITPPFWKAACCTIPLYSFCEIVQIALFLLLSLS